MGYILSALNEATRKDRNFLNEYREETQNNAPLVSINEVNAKSMLDRHSQHGYIIVSPCRGGDDFNLDTTKQEDREKLAHINKGRVKDIIGKIKASGYSYTPVYGGFIENKGTDHEENVYERSFVIYNHNRQGVIGNMEDLIKFGNELAKTYNQDSFLVKTPNGKPQYITQDGNVDMEFDGDVAFNDMAQEYFTDLHKNTNKFKDTDKRTPTRFSFVEAYVNPAPQCYSERHVRSMMNEVFLNAFQN